MQTFEIKKFAFVHIKVNTSLLGDKYFADRKNENFCGKKLILYFSKRTDGIKKDRFMSLYNCNEILVAFPLFCANRV